MPRKRIKEIVMFFNKVLKTNGFSDFKTILFGSQTTGHASPESDVDIVVVSKKFEKKDIFQRGRMIKKAEMDTIKKYMIPMDVMTLTPQEFDNQNSLIAQYAKTGIQF